MSNKKNSANENLLLFIGFCFGMYVGFNVARDLYKPEMLNPQNLNSDNKIDYVVTSSINKKFPFIQLENDSFSLVENISKEYEKRYLEECNTNIDSLRKTISEIEMKVRDK